MVEKHKHHDVIVAFANGADVQRYVEYDNQPPFKSYWETLTTPTFDYPRMRVDPVCRYAYEEIEKLGDISLYNLWLEGEKLEIQTDSGDWAYLLECRPSQECFELYKEFLENGHVLREAVPKVEKFLWVRVGGDLLVKDGKTFKPICWCREDQRPAWTIDENGWVNTGYKEEFYEEKEE